MTPPRTKQQRQLEGALLGAAGQLARSGKYSFEDIVAKLSSAASPEVADALRRPHIADALRRLCDAAKFPRHVKEREVHGGD